MVRALAAAIITGVALTVVFVDKPEPVVELAGGLPFSRPVVNNLILSLLSTGWPIRSPVAIGWSPTALILEVLSCSRPSDFPAAITRMPPMPSIRSSPRLPTPA